MKNSPTTYPTIATSASWHNKQLLFLCLTFLLLCCCGFISQAQTYNAPYDIPRFQDFIGECKLQAPTSSTEATNSELKAGYTSSWFYVVNGDKVAFNQSGSKQRTELRDLRNWDLTQADQSLFGKIDIVQQTCDQVTVMQIHDDANVGSGPNKPLLRIYKHNAKSPTNHIWAAIKTDNGGSNTTHIDLGADPGGYFTCHIKLENSRLIIDYEGVEKVNMDVSFWSFPSYWKAGVYLQDNGEATAHFDELYTGTPPVSNNAPTTSITSPANGASFNEGDNITISADASDTDGTVSKVEFFQGATKLGEDLTAPYSFAWNNVAAGSYDLTTVATDDQGATGTS
ncbi:polysaccharide lyase family 7 protein, partial [Marinoscillum furvescens]|uniref:polysaccharide lyase family 7 protein n=1 Tax=Marinoscillum furvescens TaxID=1026 RepID=UPI00162525E0